MFRLWLELPIMALPCFFLFKAHWSDHFAGLSVTLSSSPLPEIFTSSRVSTSHPESIAFSLVVFFFSFFFSHQEHQLEPNMGQPVPRVPAVKQVCSVAVQ